MNTHYNVTCNNLASLWKPVLLGLMLIISIHANSQKRRNAAFIHMRGVQGFEVFGGISDLGISGSAYYLHFLNPRWFGKVGGLYETDLDDRFTNHTVSIELLVCSNLIIRRSFFLHYQIGPNLCLERLYGLSESYQNWSLHPGITTGVSLEKYLNRSIAFTSNGMLRFVPQSNIGKTRLYLNVGIRYLY